LAQTEEEDNLEIEELQWLAVGKATAQTYGIVMNTLLDQIIPFNDDLWYWDSILGSHRYTLLYWTQTSPLRFQNWARDIYSDVKERFDEIRGGDDIRPLQTFQQQWGQFYGLVKTSIEKRSLSTVRSAVISPMALVEQEIKIKRQDLKKLMEMSASGLGVLMDEGLSFDVDLNGAASTRTSESGKERKDDWKGVVEKSIALTESVLNKITAEDISVHEFEDTVFANIDDDLESGIVTSEENSSSSRPGLLTKRLLRILDSTMPSHMEASSILARSSGRPSALIRYWLPATALILSSATLLRILVSRKAAIRTWIQDFGNTVIDFWFNWVVEPSKKVIGTIRHDKDSEVAIMSKKSLEGDRASLERMAVDFAKDNGTSGSLSEADISNIRAKVQEGDLTTVLVAYERDLRRPFVGTVKGDLVRALLIQIQKTKVDVEVAMGGIDALLKSQELVFG
jgi:nuclear-control-of-ATPase protein 2